MTNNRAARLVLLARVTAWQETQAGMSWPEALETATALIRDLAAALQEVPVSSETAPGRDPVAD